MSDEETRKEEQASEAEASEASEETQAQTDGGEHRPQRGESFGDMPAAQQVVGSQAPQLHRLARARAVGQQAILASRLRTAPSMGEGLRELLPQRSLL